ncbi:MAG: (d)CMP kinase [Clostridiales bacterium]|nr:(d)CMP kinase [Clostridiales bacterium]
MVIAIDGQSGTGKSTLAGILAKRLNFKSLNTGMIYRAIAHYFLSTGINPEDLAKIEECLKTINIEIKFKGDKQYIIINNIDCTPFVSSEDVQKNVSLFSQILPIRDKILSLQREFALYNDIVVEGRDIGTHVFPNADVKFFVSCNIDVRAERRLKDLKQLGQDISLQQVKESLKSRDLLDTTRKFCPLRRADDAIDIDTSYKTIDECINEMLLYILKG